MPAANEGYMHAPDSQSAVADIGARPCPNDDAPHLLRFKALDSLGALSHDAALLRCRDHLVDTAQMVEYFIQTIEKTH